MAEIQKVFPSWTLNTFLIYLLIWQLLNNEQSRPNHNKDGMDKKKEGDKSDNEWQEAELVPRKGQKPDIQTT